MIALLIAVLTGLSVLCLRAIALPASAAIVKVWVRLYTFGLSPARRDRRREEMESHIRDQITEAQESGYSPDLIAVHILLLLLLGAPQDLSWRFGGPPVAPMQPDRFDAQSSEVPARVRGFTDVYGNTFPRLFAYVYGAVRDKEKTLDLVSEVFEEFYLDRGSEQPDFQVSLFKRARLRIRRAFLDEEIILSELPEIFPDQTDMESGELLHDERLRLLTRLLARLPIDIQEIIALKFDAELSNSEIAAVCALPEPLVRVRIFRALQSLRVQLGEAPNRRGIGDQDDDAGHGGALVPA